MQADRGAHQARAGLDGQIRSSQRRVDDFAGGDKALHRVHRFGEHGLLVGVHLDVDDTLDATGTKDRRHANVKAVQTMLGHKSAALTLDTYADLFPDDLEAVADAFDAAVAALPKTTAG